MTTRVVLLVPTRSYRAAAFLKAGRRLGLELVVASERPSTLARGDPRRELVVDFRHPERAAARVASLAGGPEVRAVVAVDETGVLSGAVLGEALGGLGNRLAAVAPTRDKSRLREALTRAVVAQPRWALWEGSRPPSGIPFPAVVKPLDQAGSRGVVRVEDRAGLELAGARVRRMAEADPGWAGKGRRGPIPLLVEEFLDGPEVAMEGLLERGRLIPLAIYDKPESLQGPFFEETVYTVPSLLPGRRQKEVWDRLQAATAALGLELGPVHAEFRIGGGEPRLIDLAARSIGGRCSRVLRFRSGVTLEELILLNALGRPLPDLELEAGTAGVMMIPVPASGRLRALGGREQALAVPGVEALEITVPLGERLLAAPEGDRSLGFLFASGAGVAEVLKALREAHARLSFQIEADPSA